MSLIASEERTIEICSREILRLEKRERELEGENEDLKDVLRQASGFNVLSETESAPGWAIIGTFQERIDALLKGEQDA